MINIPPIRPSSEIKTQPIPDVTKTWKIGQLLSATAETGADAMSKVILRLGQYALETRTPVPLKAGDQLTLLVKELGTPPLLSIQTSASTEQAIAVKLRSFIAQQQSLQALTNFISKINNVDELPKEIRPLVQQLVNQLPERDQVIQPRLLKQAIQDNGIFLESKLAKSVTSHIERDIKNQLLKISHQLDSLPKQDSPKASSGQEKTGDQLSVAIKQFVDGKINIKQLAQQLLTQLPKQELTALQKILSVSAPATQTTTTPAPSVASPDVELSNDLLQLLTHIKQQPRQKQLNETLLVLLKSTPLLQELKTLVDSVLAKITSQQLSPMLSDTNNLLLLLFDLPVRHNNETHVFNFRIEQEEKSESQETSSWTVIINFDFSTTGPIQTKLHLIENSVSAVFYAERESTINQIKQNSGLLEAAFNKVGLTVINIDISKGLPGQNRITPQQIHLLDEQA